jgi:flavin reductase (DIM6/NTAB) family NADH-FMN oxidoreductase RutF
MKKSIGAQATPFPGPVWVVGTYDAEGKPNVMTASWAGVCCSKPPCVGVSLRKARYSYDNIVQRQAFTINVPSVAQAAVTDYWGMVSGRNEDKIARAGLTAVDSELVNAPYVEEFPVVLECKLVTQLEIGSHTQFIGEIVDVKVEAELLGPEDALDVGKLELFVFLKGYWGLGDYVGPAFEIGKEI